MPAEVCRWKCTQLRRGEVPFPRPQQTSSAAPACSPPPPYPPHLLQVRQFGFNLPPALLSAIFSAYDEDASGALGFDEYIQLLAELNALTSLFRRHDPAGTGHAQLDYTTFMGIVFATRS